MGGLGVCEGSVGKAKYLGSTLYAEGAQGNTEEGKGCLDRFPIGEEAHRPLPWGSGVLLPLLAVRPWGSYSYYLCISVSHL